jgi:hypothetical protein
MIDPTDQIAASQVRYLTFITVVALAVR